MKPSGGGFGSRTNPHLETSRHTAFTTDGGGARLNSDTPSFSLLLPYQTEDGFKNMREKPDTR